MRRSGTGRGAQGQGEAFGTESEGFEDRARRSGTVGDRFRDMDRVRRSRTGQGIQGQRVGVINASRFSSRYKQRLGLVGIPRSTCGADPVLDALQPKV